MKFKVFLRESVFIALVMKKMVDKMQDILFSKGFE